MPTLARVRLVWLDVGIALALLSLALLTRTPHLQTVPVITDESREVLWALRIAEGEHLPLTSVDPYNGPLFPYLMAAAFLLFGPSMELPRLVVLWLGALTVPLTFMLGRILTNSLGAWRSVPGALVGASMMLTCSPHILVNSHVAWSNSTTPFFTTLCLTAFGAALARLSVRWLVAGGLLYGFALQTHPSVIVLAPALAAWLWLDPKGRLLARGRASILSLAAASAAYSPVILHNLLFFDQAQSSISAAARRIYAFALPESLGDYLVRVGMHSVEILRALAAAFVTLPSPAAYFREPMVLLYTGLVAAALVLALWQRRWLVPAAAASTVLLIAGFNKQVDFPLAARYYAFLYPLLYLSVGELAAWAFSLLATWPRRWPALRALFHLGSGRGPYDGKETSPSTPLPFSSPAVHVPLARLLLLLALAGNLVRLAVYPLFVLVGINEFFLQNGVNSQPFFDLASRAREGQAPRVWIDQALTGPEYWMCNGVTGGEALGYLLTLNRVQVENGTLPFERAVSGDWLALKPENARMLAAQLALTQIAASPPAQIHCASEAILLLRIESRR